MRVGTGVVEQCLQTRAEHRQVVDLRAVGAVAAPSLVRVDGSAGRFDEVVDPAGAPHRARCLHPGVGCELEAEVGERASHGLVHRGLGVDHRAVEVEHDRRREHGDEGTGQPYEVRSPHMSAHGRLGPAQTQMGTPCSSLSAPTPLSTCAATLQPFQYVST